LKAEYVYVYEKKVSICTSTKNVSMCRCMNKEDQPRLAFSSIFFYRRGLLIDNSRNLLRTTTSSDLLRILEI
jgi:hypothetical protein